MNRFDKSEGFDDVSLTVMSSSISSPFERFSNWLLVPTILVEEGNRIWKIRIIKINTEVKMVYIERNEINTALKPFNPKHGQVLTIPIQEVVFYWTQKGY